MGTNQKLVNSLLKLKQGYYKSGNDYIAYFGNKGVYIETKVQSLYSTEIRIFDDVHIDNIDTLFGYNGDLIPITKDEFEAAYSEAIAMTNEILQLQQMAQ